jgi:hypothetical protein
MLIPNQDASQDIFGYLVVAVGLVSFLIRSLWGKRPPFPPGPRAEFLLGHLRVVPKENTAETYARWGREHSESSFLSHQDVHLD